MTRTINVRGSDLQQARQALSELVGELNRRSAGLVEAGRESWSGPPDLLLVACGLPQILADVRCRDLFRRALASGRKLGLRGMAYGGGRTVASLGGCPVIRDLLAAGSPLIHIYGSDATSNATVTHR
jgi:hypothetical protein